MQWVIRISNTHRSISHEEIETFFDKNEIEWIMPLIVEINTDEDKLSEFISMSASIKYVLIEPLYFDLSSTAYSKLFSDDLDLKIPKPPKQTTYAVRFKRIFDERGKVERSRIEREFGRIIGEQYSNLTVNLDDPDNYFYVLSWQDMIVIGWRYYESNFADIANRSPKESPFFGGGAMKSMLSKLLVNLHYPFDVVMLDPFCGHGGLLREIAETCSFAIGIEVSAKIARECRINNFYHEYDHSINVIIGDSTRPPLRGDSIKQIVTDPPYAIQTTTKGMDRVNLVLKWMATLQKGTRLIMTLPHDLLEEVPKEWQIEFAADDFVHKSLTRRVRRLVKQ